MPDYKVSTTNTLDLDSAAAFRRSLNNGTDPLDDEEKKKKQMEEDDTPKASRYLSSTSKASSYLKQ